MAGQLGQHHLPGKRALEYSILLIYIFLPMFLHQFLYLSQFLPHLPISYLNVTCLEALCCFSFSLIQAEPDEIQGLFYSVRSLLLVHIVQNLSHHLCFYACFWTSWAWNKDTVLLYTVLYSKYAKALALVEDTHMLKCTPDTWTNSWLDMRTHVRILKAHNLKVCM